MVQKISWGIPCQPLRTRWSAHKITNSSRSSYNIYYICETLKQDTMKLTRSLVVEHLVNLFLCTCKNTLVCMLLSYRLIVIQLERCNERYGLYGSARRRRRNSGMGDGWTSSAGGANAVDRYYKYSTRVNLREPAVDPNEPEVKYVVRERYAAELCARVFCPIGGRQAVADRPGQQLRFRPVTDVGLLEPQLNCGRA